MMATARPEVRAGSSPRWSGGEDDPAFHIQRPSLSRGLASAITQWHLVASAPELTWALHFTDRITQVQDALTD